MIKFFLMIYTKFGTKLCLFHIIIKWKIHLGLLPYPKENDTSEEVSMYLLSF